MEIGLNADIQVHGRAFHVQTEDWGWDNPFIVTKIFCEGEVLKSIKTPYKEVLQSPFANEKDIGQALAIQHQTVLDHLYKSPL